MPIQKKLFIVHFSLFIIIHYSFFPLRSGNSTAKFRCWGNFHSLWSFPESSWFLRWRMQGRSHRVISGAEHSLGAWRDVTVIRQWQVKRPSADEGKPSPDTYRKFCQHSTQAHPNCHYSVSTQCLNNTSLARLLLALDLHLYPYSRTSPSLVTSRLCPNSCKPPWSSLLFLLSKPTTISFLAQMKAFFPQRHLFSTSSSNLLLFLHSMMPIRTRTQIREKSVPFSWGARRTERSYPSRRLGNYLYTN